MTVTHVLSIVLSLVNSQYLVFNLLYKHNHIKAKQIKLN